MFCPPAASNNINTNFGKSLAKIDDILKWKSKCKVARYKFQSALCSRNKKYDKRL